jgi:hypothetical protein
VFVGATAIETLPKHPTLIFRSQLIYGGIAGQI